MVKYIGYALALKTFSCGAPMRRLYRLLGNHFGSRRRAFGSMPDYYVERVARMVELARTHGVVRDGGRVLELGSGWLHWEAITLGLFFDIEAVLFDVWDNRQLSGLKNYLQQLQAKLHGQFGGVSDDLLARARDRIGMVLSVKSFDELYGLFGFQYVIDSSGSLSQFSNESFDLVVSGGVLEHVKREAVAPMLRDAYRLLKPSGWALHGINIADHLSHYDRTVSKKFYLSVPEWVWRGLVQNEVQYINRLQKGEWMNLFRESGFDVVTESGARVDISGLKMAKRFRQMDRTELQYTSLRVLLRKAKLD
jgi:SAM-dependent methyltransferase